MPAEDSHEHEEQLARKTLEDIEAAGDRTATEPSDSLEIARRHQQSKHAHHPDSIGPYKILDVLGEGGMGVVYLAEQTKPIRRRVALKLIKLGMDSKQVIARFESERQALAMMDHPGVAKVFDAGTSDQGRPYFVMELVHGLPITEHCDRHKLGIEERLKLFIDTCEAVQHAHQKGIIHRDIKPTNILVEYADGKATPKIIDFGVAKATSQPLTEKTLFTEQGQLIGTPAYMSPEQADLSAQDIDTRSDIYSLGMLLYELLTGMLPFDPKSLRRAGFHEIQRIIREEEPRKPSTRLSSLSSDGTESPAGSADKSEPRAQATGPSTPRSRSGLGSAADVAKRRRSDPRSLVKRIRGDLDWIVLKCLEKDRARRYETANGLALDIRRHLTNEPVLASPPTAGYRLKKFVRRNPTGVVATGVIALILVSATAISINFARREADQRRIAVAAERQQNRAREQAEEARASEAEQRRVAEEREAEAVAARAETQKRADELKTVTDFQQSMLGEIDAEKMGRGIIADLRERVEARLTERKLEPGKATAALSGFDEAVQGVNATNLALKLIDENVLARAVEAIHQQFADQPLVRAALEETVANTYLEIGLFEPAMPLQQAALETRRDRLGDDHPDTAGSIGNMGLLLKAMGKYEEALPYFREALEGSRRVLGDDHPQTLTSINNMGLVLRAMGKYEEALPYSRNALEGGRRVLGNDHPDTLISIINMGLLLKSMGKYEEALPYYREALEGCRRVLGDDHPHTFTSINNMGGLLTGMGKYEEALPYFSEALDGGRRVLGDDHPRTLISINNMGGLLTRMGKYEEALPYLREAMEGNRRVLGDDRPDTLISISNMGFVFRSMGKYEEALPYAREALDACRRVLGDDHPDTLGSISDMARLLKAMDRIEEAEPYYREAMEGRRRVLGDDHPDTLSSIGNMGALLNQLGRHEDAADVLQAGEPAARRVRTGVNARWLGDYLAKLGDARVGQGKFPAAQKTLLEAYELLFAGFGEDHERTTKTVKRLITLYDAWDAAEPGLGYAAKAAEWRAKLAETQPADSMEATTTTGPK